jgi:hypothetical protein
MLLFFSALVIPISNGPELKDPERVLQESPGRKPWGNGVVRVEPCEGGTNRFALTGLSHFFFPRSPRACALGCRC